MIKNKEFLVRADTTEPADFSGTAFSHLDVRWLVNEDRSGSSMMGVGQTIYPSNGGTHEVHSHPNAEEVVIVQSGHGRHLIGDTWYDIKPGDVVFIPRNTPHAAESVGEENMVIYWMLGGVGSFEAAGYKKEK